MFFEDPRGVLQCAAWRDWTWMDHGFSTRHSAGWLEDKALSSLKQVHGDRVLEAAAAGVLGEADGLITNRAGLHLGIRTADCFPILLADPVKQAVGAVHAGWRGTVAQSVLRAVEQMQARYGTSAADLHAAVGPGIGDCCFEVGPEVAAEFGRHGRVKVDLGEALERQLRTAGLPAGQIYLARECTLCQPESYWSYRREREQAGRMWSGIARLAQA